MASLNAEDPVKVIDYKMFGGSLVERSVARDHDSIVKRDRATGVVVSFSPVGEGFTGVRLIIENPDGAEGIIVGTLEIPFPKNGDSKIVVIPNIIELRLFNGSSPSVLSATSHYKHHNQTLADRLRISNVYENSDGNGAFVSQSRINPNLTETLLGIIRVHKNEIKKRICSNHESKNTNCIIVSMQSADEDYFICGQCRKYLSTKDEYKCSKCSAPVFIGPKGNAKNKLCNSCSNH
jgi:uncharacterized CHY-type Zn-finger protein